MAEPTLLRDLPVASLAAVLERLESMFRFTPPEPEKMITEEGRLRFARECGAHDVVNKLKRAIQESVTK